MKRSSALAELFICDKGTMTHSPQDHTQRSHEPEITPPHRGKKPEASKSSDDSSSSPIGTPEDNQHRVDGPPPRRRALNAFASQESLPEKEEAQKKNKQKIPVRSMGTMLHHRTLIYLCPDERNLVSPYFDAEGRRTVKFEQLSGSSLKAMLKYCAFRGQIEDSFKKRRREKGNIVWTIPDFIEFQPDLSDTEKKFLALVHYSASKRGGCYWQNHSFALVLGLTDQAVKDMIRTLEKAGFLGRREKDDYCQRLLWPAFWLEGSGYKTEPVVDELLDESSSDYTGDSHTNTKASSSDDREGGSGTHDSSENIEDSDQPLSASPSGAKKERDNNNNKSKAAGKPGVVIVVPLLPSANGKGASPPAPPANVPASAPAARTAIKESVSTLQENKQDANNQTREGSLDSSEEDGNSAGTHTKGKASSTTCYLQDTTNAKQALTGSKHEQGSAIGASRQKADPASLSETGKTKVVAASAPAAQIAGEHDSQGRLVAQRKNSQFQNNASSPVTKPNLFPEAAKVNSSAKALPATAPEAHVASEQAPASGPVAVQPKKDDPLRLHNDDGNAARRTKLFLATAEELHQEIFGFPLRFTSKDFDAAKDYFSVHWDEPSLVFQATTQLALAWRNWDNQETGSTLDSGEPFKLFLYCEKSRHLRKFFNYIVEIETELGRKYKGECPESVQNRVIACTDRARERLGLAPGERVAR